MDIENLEHLRRVAISALASDEGLRNELVLKGGNAIDLFYGLATRSSMDLDFSIAADFPSEEWLHRRIDGLLSSRFSAEGYEVFDLAVSEVPADVTNDLRDFWGGYRIEFKLIESRSASTLHGKPEQRRRNAAVVSAGNRRKFKIDISKHEYCSNKVLHDCLGSTVFVYSPSLLVAEKLRAICQQMPQYRQLVKSPSGSPRARDFVDIWSISINTSLNVATPEFATLIDRVFAAKRVPRELLGRIHEHRQFHASDYPSVLATLKPTGQTGDFDFYFDYVIALTKQLKSLWMV